MDLQVLCKCFFKSIKKMSGFHVFSIQLRLSIITIHNFLQVSSGCDTGIINKSKIMYPEIPNFDCF